MRLRQLTRRSSSFRVPPSLPQCRKHEVMTTAVRRKRQEFFCVTVLRLRFHSGTERITSPTLILFSAYAPATAALPSDRTSKTSISLTKVGVPPNGIEVSGSSNSSGSFTTGSLSPTLTLPGFWMTRPETSLIFLIVGEDSCNHLKQ